jgi:hypothetical protein
MDKPFQFTNKNEKDRQNCGLMIVINSDSLFEWGNLLKK